MEYMPETLTVMDKLVEENILGKFELDNTIVFSIYSITVSV